MLGKSTGPISRDKHWLIKKTLLAMSPEFRKGCRGQNDWELGHRQARQFMCAIAHAAYYPYCCVNLVVCSRRMQDVIGRMHLSAKELQILCCAYRDSVSVDISADQTCPKVVTATAAFLDEQRRKICSMYLVFRVSSGEASLVNIRPMGAH